jgi:hypothetical protein
MDPLTDFYGQLRQCSPVPRHLEAEPRIEEWLRFWNDDDTDLGNLRNFEHWLAVGAGTPTRMTSQER